MPARTPSAQRPIIGVSALVQRQGKILVVQRGKAPGAGQIAFPGGKLQWGEAPAYAKYCFSQSKSKPPVCLPRTISFGLVFQINYGSMCKFLKNAGMPMKTDVIIVGAGPAGLCLACVLAHAGLEVTLVDKQPLAQLAHPDFDGREIALTHESRRLLQQWGLWERLPADEISNLRHAQVLDGSIQQGLFIDAALGQKSQLGWFVPNYCIRQAAYDHIKDHPRVRLLPDSEIKGIKDTAQGYRLDLGPHGPLEGRLLVAADGRFSQTRRALGISSPMIDYGKSMTVFRVEHSKPHHHIAWEWFGYGQTRALLPLNGQRSSVVLTLPQHEMQTLMNLEEEAFNEDISQRFEYRLGAMRRLTPLTTYPLVGTYAARFHGPRFALIGDAAVGMHPVTAHGFNLGLLSVKHLAQQIIPAWQQGRDFTQPALLGAYTRAHRRSSLPLFAATNLIVALYTNDRARLPRQALLKAANRFIPFKRQVATHLTG